MFETLTPHVNERRIPFIIVHGIMVSLEKADEILSGKTAYEASVHYMIACDGQVTQYVNEVQRAWHAGLSYWAGITDINSVSIGIELEHQPVIEVETDFYRVHYTAPQMAVLAGMLHDLIERHKVLPANILSHQDIAPHRKYDPGPNFDWAYLAEKGIGLWHDLAPVSHDAIIQDAAQIECFKRGLGMYGYDMRGCDDAAVFAGVVKAFQTHFLPWNICGDVTAQSIEALDILLKKKLA